MPGTRRRETSDERPGRAERIEVRGRLLQPLEERVHLPASTSEHLASARRVRRVLPPPRQRCEPRAMSFLQLVTIIVDDYDPAIRFFVDVLGFGLAEDVPATTNDGRPKRWVVVRPRVGEGWAETGILLAKADGEVQRAAVGQQMAGRVGFFLRVDDFDATFARMTAAGVVFVRPPRVEDYGRIAVFVDIAGNRWDLLGPAAAS